MIENGNIMPQIFQINPEKNLYSLYRKNLIKIIMLISRIIFHQKNNIESLLYNITLNIQ